MLDGGYQRRVPVPRLATVKPDTFSFAKPAWQSEDTVNPMRLLARSLAKPSPPDLLLGREVAFLTGYSEQSGFQQAVKRWRRRR